MRQHIGFAIIVAALAFMTWATGMAAQGNHDMVALGFYTLFASLLAVIVIAWFCETFKSFSPGLVTIKGDKY